MRFNQIVETTTAGSVATVAQPMMTQTRENINVPGLKPVQQLMKGKSKKKGLYANSIVESKVTEDDLAEQDLIVIPGQGRLRRTGFVKQDLDQGEHEGHTLKNSLHTIARAASDLDKRLSTQSEFPEWVSEKIGAAKGMMVTVMDYLISSQEMQHDTDAMNEDMSNTDYTPQVGEEILWRSRNPMNKMMPVPGTVLAIAPGKVTIKIKSPRLIQNIGKDTIVLNLSNYVLMPKQGVAEGWKDEANDYKEWSNHVKNELLSVAPSQQYSMALRLSQIERKHFGSEIETGFNTQTGRPDSTSNKGLTGTVSQIFRAIKDGSLGAAAPAAGTQSTAFGTVTRPADQPASYNASPALAGGDSQAALNSLKGDSNYPAATTLSGPSSGTIKILRTEEEWEEALNNQDSGADRPMTAAGFGAAMAKLPSWKVMLATIMLASKLPIIGDKIKNNIISSIKNEFGVQMSFKEALGYMQHVRTTPPDEIVSPAVWKFEKDGGDYETAIEQLPDDEVNVSPAHVMATISNDLISSGLAQEIKPEKEEKPTSGGAGAFGNMASQLTQKKEPVAEAMGGGVDAKGRTQAQWMNLVKAKFPDAKMQQAKMIDGPCQATLPDGRKLSWRKVEQGVAEGEKNTSYMNKQNQDFYNKNPNFKRDDRGVKFVGNQLASIVTPTNKPGQVAKKPMTPFKTQGVAENNRPFRGVDGAFDRGEDERHDLDPTDWYIVKDGEMFSASIYPRQVQQAIAQGFSRTRAEAKSRANSQGMAEGSENILPRGTSVTVLHKGKQVPGKIVRYDAGKGGYSPAYVVDIGEYESIFVPVSKIQQQGVEEEKIDFAKKLQKNVDKSNKAVVKTRQDIGSRIADIGAGGKEYNVKTDAAWDAAKKKVADKIDNKK